VYAEAPLTHEQRLLKRTLREFADREIVPHSLKWDEAEAMDKAVLFHLAELGVLGATLPREFGGSDLDNVSVCLLMEELGRADPSVRAVVSVNIGLVGKTILRWGTDDQKDAWLPGLCSGEGIGCFALTEPDAGSDAAALRTTARRNGGDWLVNGTKMFITNGTWARISLVFARTADPAAGITAFVVPTDSPGFSAAPLKRKLGLKAADTAELSLNDVRVPDRYRLGEVGQGFKVAMSALDGGRLSLAAGCVGLGQACLDTSVAYARERRAFGAPIASLQLVQELLADMAVEVHGARLMTFHCATLADAGASHTLESAYAKLFASEAAVRAANAAVQVHGGYGYMEEYRVAKYLRDARVTTVYEGSSQIQKLIIGRLLTGASAFSASLH
jgi:alkylation response protein AidB-like acyl-CoA dehydrogenase